ncbi:unnamed protein product [Fusarium graminearum]|nr:unnamed protein product [Fusarium graminearum]
MHDTTVGDVEADLEGDKNPGFGISEGFSALFPFELIILDTSKIVLNPDDGLLSILFGQEPGGVRGIRE